MSESQRGKGGICSIFREAFMPRHEKELIVADKLEEIEEVLEDLYEKIKKVRKDMTDLKGSLRILMDKSKKVVTMGLSRDSTIKNYKYRLTMLMRQEKSMEEHVNLLERMKCNIAGSRAAISIASTMSSLRENLMEVSDGIDVDQLQDDMNEIEETNREMQEITNLVNDNIRINTWDADMGDMDRLLEEYLATDDDTFSVGEAAAAHEQAFDEPDEGSQVALVHQETNDQESVQDEAGREEAPTTTTPHRKKTKKSKKHAVTSELIAIQG